MKTLNIRFTGYITSIRHYWLSDCSISLDGVYIYADGDN